MNAKLALKLLLNGAVITIVFYCLRGHDVLTGIALSLLLLLTVAKLIFAVVLHSRGNSFGDGGIPPAPMVPVPVPTPSRPPGAPPEIHCAQKF